MLRQLFRHISKRRDRRRGVENACVWIDPQNNVSDIVSKQAEPRLALRQFGLASMGLGDIK